MDRVQARNIFIILITIVALTLGTFGVLLWRIGAGLPVPDMLENLATGMLGILTGSAVSLSAKPRVIEGEPTTVVNNQQGPPGGVGNVFVSGGGAGGGGGSVDVVADEPLYTPEVDMDDGPSMGERNT